MAINLDQVESQVAAARRGNPAVARAQAILAQLGHYSTSVDGIMGSNTRTAIGKLIENQSAFESLSSSDRAQIQVAITALDRVPLNPENSAAVSTATTRIDEFQRTCAARTAALQVTAPAAPAAAAEAATPDAPAASPADRIREAQRVLHGRGYYPANRTEEKAVDGIIGRETRAAIGKANEAVLAATANGRECPPELQDVARAHQTLTELGGQAAREAAPAAKRQGRSERGEGEAALARRRQRPAEAEGEAAERPVRTRRKQPVEAKDDERPRSPRGSTEEQPHLKNRGEKYGDEIQGMQRWSDERVARTLGESYRGAPIFHVGPKLPEDRGNRIQPATERELVPLQTRPTAKHPNGLRAWVPNGWHFDLQSKLRDHSVTLPANEFYTLQPGTGVVLDRSGKPLHGVTPSRPGAFGEIRESAHSGGDSGVGTGGAGTGGGTGGGCCGGGGPGGGAGGPGGGGGGGGASLDPLLTRPDVLKQLEGGLPLTVVASADVAAQKVPDARTAEQRDRGQTQLV